MEKFTLTLEIDPEDPGALTAEIVTLLRDAATRIERNYPGVYFPTGSIWDVNGNRVGSYATLQMDAETIPQHRDPAHVALCAVCQERNAAGPGMSELTCFTRSTYTDFGFVVHRSDCRDIRTEYRDHDAQVIGRAANVLNAIDVILDEELIGMGYTARDVKIYPCCTA